jgi:hypothetical protein
LLTSYDIFNVVIFETPKKFGIARV